MMIVSLAAPAGAVFASADEVVVGSAPEIIEVQVGDDTIEGLNDTEGVAEEATDAIEEIDGEVLAAPVAPSVAAEIEEVPEVDQLTEVNPVRAAGKQLVISYVQAADVYGKFVEITNITNQDYETKGLTLQYIRANDPTGSNPDVLVSFYGTIKAGESVVVGNETARMNSEQTADVYYTQTANAVMSAAGGWLLLTDGTSELDSFCWAANARGICGDDFYPQISLTQDGAYGRCSDGDRLAPCADGLPFMQVARRVMQAGGGFVPYYNSCTGLMVNEVAPQVMDQFIELYNWTDHAFSLEKCLLQINSRVYQFSIEDGVIGPGEYRVIDPAKINTTLARTTAGEVRLLASDGAIVDRLPYTTPRENRSVITTENGEVVWTLTMTPGAENHYLQHHPCADGYLRNEETGNCNKIQAAAVPTDCGEGRERNPETNRCRNIPAARQLTPLPRGAVSQRRNQSLPINCAGGKLTQAVWRRPIPQPSHQSL